MDWSKLANDKGFGTSTEMVMTYRADGFTYNAIAIELSVSASTVHNHAMELVGDGVIKMSDIKRRNNSVRDKT